MPDHLGQLPSLAAKKFGNKEALYYENRSFSFNEISAIILYRIICGTFSGLFGNSKTIHRGKCS